MTKVIDLVDVIQVVGDRDVIYVADLRDVI